MRPGRLLAVAAVAAALLAVMPAAQAARPTPMERSVLAVMNEARAAHGLAPLRFAWPLQDRSRAYARALIVRDVFQHAALPSGTRENLAWATARIATARRLVQIWLGSPAHRANVLWPAARRAGVGVVRGDFRGMDARMAVARFRR